MKLFRNESLNEEERNFIFKILKFSISYAYFSVKFSHGLWLIFHVSFSCLPGFPRGTSSLSQYQLQQCWYATMLQFTPWNYWIGCVIHYRRNCIFLAHKNINVLINLSTLNGMINQNQNFMYPNKRKTTKLRKILL